ncbi:MAG: isochorismatase family protein [Planctomycetes bacterium]|nr:isochorismatase family protein [Planctomycetota bacterium]
MKPLIVLLSLAFFFRPARGDAAEAPLKVCLLSGSFEYESDKSLSAFKQHLESSYPVEATLLRAISMKEMPSLEPLERCDVALIFTRRIELEGEQLERFKKYCLSGRPIVGIRTASHAVQTWLEFDRLVLGGNYHGHYGKGPTARVEIHPEAAGHPVLRGVPPFRSLASLYKAGPIAEDAELLLTGATPDGTEPSAWTRSYNGGRIFYTSLGTVDDFENAAFRQLIANALFWTAGREVPARKFPPVALRPNTGAALKLHLRSRVEAFKGSGQWEEVRLEKAIPASEMAIIICDMWDQHWCRGATERCGKLAGKMNAAAAAARAKGVQIIHAPSETMSFYEGTVQRRRVQLAPKTAPPPKDLDLKDPPLPIDDSDGGCDTAEKPWHMAWTRQDAKIEIGELDGVSDNGQEIYRFLKQLGVKHVLIMGVHTNMCVLGRSFAIRQLTRWGFRCVLVRDLTDTMYDPKDPPHASHEEGTELVVQHIEKYWCPSITSDDLVKN